ncbi:transcription factor HES-5-like [Microcaecilia unicolor]|uniref:Transcription factor HES-5 n=1 Tax=Microcaecilia unicolor TaxID=1415580 RepID=A0A6P7ZLB2_9AMPH|nr:transcription factor HES-5-like [Microcaecilia unicolor]
MTPTKMLLKSQYTEDKGKQIRKLRKPVVEKLRRDRINSSIEQLRLLLEKEFQRHQLPSKPEKADILETAVSYLRQHQQEAAKTVTSGSESYREGYCSCLQDSLHFLSLGPETETQLRLRSELQRSPAAAEGQEHPKFAACHPSPKQATQHSSKSLWRPCFMPSEGLRILTLANVWAFEEYQGKPYEEDVLATIIQSALCHLDRLIQFWFYSIASMDL